MDESRKICGPETSNNDLRCQRRRPPIYLLSVRSHMHMICPAFMLRGHAVDHDLSALVSQSITHLASHTKQRQHHVKFMFMAVCASHAEQRQRQNHAHSHTTCHNLLQPVTHNPQHPRTASPMRSKTLRRVAVTTTTHGGTPTFLAEFRRIAPPNFVISTSGVFVGPEARSVVASRY